MSTSMEPIELDAGGEVRAMTFSPDGKYLVSGQSETVRIWRLEGDTWKMTKILEAGVHCLSVAVSRDSKWIAAGTTAGWVFAWDATTLEKVFAETLDSYYGINGVDFSLDGTQLVSASDNHKATVWDIGTGEQAQTLQHQDWVRVAKYSPQGERIATASQYNSLRVWNSNDGTLLASIRVAVTPWRNPGLLWFDNHLFAVSDRKVKEYDSSTGSAVAEWLVPDSDKTSCIVLLNHGEIIAHSTDRAVTFWDRSTHLQLSLVQDPQDKLSVACSADDRLLAIGGNGGKITIQNLPDVSSTGLIPRSRPHATLQESKLQVDGTAPDSTVPLSHLHPTFQEPEIKINDAILNSWKNDELADAEVSLTAAIDKSQKPNHHLLASRALVRTHLGHWDAALVDAEMGMESQPSVIGYIAKSVALVGKGESDKAYRVCDIAFERFHSSHVTFLLLIKAIIAFMAGKHRDAIARVDDLIATVHHNSICYVVQAYMHFLVGSLDMERSDYESAIQSLELARTQMRHHMSRPLIVISLISGWKFNVLDIMIRHRLCEALDAVGRIKEAVVCSYEITNGLADLHAEHLEWALDFWQRSSKKLEYLGDTAMATERYDEAISYYTIVLSINPTFPQDILTKRNKAFVASGSWKQALDDANQAIAFNPLSPWGYEMKYLALHKAAEYDQAIEAFEAMLSKIADSPDADIQQYGNQYINPSTTRVAIRKVVHQIMRYMPRVLINTTTGRLHDRAQQESAFESSLVFKELLSSMTKRIDYVRIKREVRQYFRYVMLSHRWEENEPLFQQVIHVAVYDLDQSPTHDKLQTFCKIVRDEGFLWAWSDTCCINKSDHFVLQEALVAMFRWYQGSVMTIVFLRGVRSTSQLGALVGSVWNTRAWTLQEYIASKVVRFYTEEWTPYLALKLPNHKESPEIILEMEQATGVSAQRLRALHPGLSSIREKLRLASTRQTTLVEDAAYSLLGIFSVVGIPAIYGEGEGSLGRLLAHILAGSGDVSILAWTGESGSYNSCLPAHITVFDRAATSHLPQAISDAKMDTIIDSSRSSVNLDVALELYDRLHALPPPWFTANRMKLPCIAFELPPFRTRSGRVYRADTLTFGTLEIKTRQDLSRLNSLYLIHPWLDTLLERGKTFSGAFVEGDVAPQFSPNVDDGGMSDDQVCEPNASTQDESDDDDFWSLSDPGSSPRTAPALMVPDRETRAWRMMAWLRQPFGALLVAPTGERSVDYKRVITDALVTVQIQETVSLGDVLDSIRILDVL